MQITSARARTRIEGSRRGRIATAIGLTGTLALGSLALLSPLGSTASATPPPAAKAPTVIFTEDFEHGLADNQIALLTRDDVPAYPRYVGAGGELYTADPVWESIPACDGLVLDGHPTAAQVQATGCTSGGNAWVNLPKMASILGGGAGDPTNHAVSAYTNVASLDYVGIELATASDLPLAVNGRFVTFSVDVASTCSNNHPRLRFYLVDQGDEIPVGPAAINPCTSPNAHLVDGIRVGSFASDGAILFTGASLGIVLRNEQPSGSGNDHAFDNIRVLDATPELSKDFAPAVAQSGQSATLTFTVTNTTELGTKPGWSFTDALPAGMTVAATPNASTTCANTTFAPAAGASSVTATGDLATGQASCTLSVDVVAPNGTYANGPGQVTTTGLDGPAEAATVKFNAPPTVSSGPDEGETVFLGQDAQVTYTCADSDGTVVTCDGSVPNGTPVDTSTPGDRSYTVTATDDDGGTTTVTRTFRVVGTAGVCRGTALALPLNLSFGVANGPLSPCATASKNTLKVNEFIGLPVPLLPLLNNNVAAGVLLGHSESGPGLAAADATVASTGVVIPSLGLNLQVTGAATTARSQLTSCAAPATLTGTSTIDSLKLNGITIPLIQGTPISIPLVVGALHINQTVVQGNTITTRAVFLDLPGTALDVIIAESIAGAVCTS